MKLILSFFVFATTSQLYAKDKSYGCGLGRMVAPKDSLLSTTTAGVVDFFVPIRISATTTGTSGCAKHDLVILEKPGALYAQANYQMLEMDSAMGSGEYLSGLAVQMGCAPAETESFKNYMKTNFQSLFEAQSNGIELYMKIRKGIDGRINCQERNS